MNEDYFDFTLTYENEDYSENENHNKVAELNVVSEKLEHAIIALRNLRNPDTIEDMPSIVVLLFEKAAEVFQNETQLSVDQDSVEFSKFVDSNNTWRNTELQLFVEEDETQETYNVTLNFYAPGFVEMMKMFEALTTDQNLENVLQQFIE